MKLFVVPLALVLLTGAHCPARRNVVDAKGPVPVGSYPDGASWVGAMDMTGNAMGWVSAWLDVRYYTENAVVDPTGPAAGKVKVEKGGWWGSNPFVSRVVSSP